MDKRVVRLPANFISSVRPHWFFYICIYISLFSFQLFLFILLLLFFSSRRCLICGRFQRHENRGGVIHTQRCWIIYEAGNFASFGLCYNHHNFWGFCTRVSEMALSFSGGGIYFKLYTWFSIILIRPVICSDVIFTLLFSVIGLNNSGKECRFGHLLLKNYFEWWDVSGARFR